MEIFNVEEPKLGIILYRNAIPENTNIPKRLEDTLTGSKHEYFKWNEAMVGYNEKMPEYRDCYDLKIGPKHWPHLPAELSEIKNVSKEEFELSQIETENWLNPLMKKISHLS